MQERQPVKPAQVDPFAAELLTGLGQYPCAQHIVLGGYFALKHYCDYRLTHDVDAWWSEESAERDREGVRQALKSVIVHIRQRHQLQWNQHQP